MTIRYTPEAMRDIQGIRYYISKVLHNPSAAKRISKVILDACSSLKRHPLLGASVEKRLGIPSELRYLLCEHYIVFYRVDEKTISIARVMDGQQDYLRILFDEEKSN